MSGNLDIISPPEKEIYIQGAKYTVQRAGAGKIKLIIDEVSKVMHAVGYENLFDEVKKMFFAPVTTSVQQPIDVIEFIFKFVREHLFDMLTTSFDTVVRLTAITLLSNNDLKEAEKTNKLSKVIDEKALELKWDANFTHADFATIFEALIESLDIERTIKNWTSSIGSLNVLQKLEGVGILNIQKMTKTETGDTIGPVSGSPMPK